MRPVTAWILVLSVCIAATAIGPRGTEAEESPYAEDTAPVYFIISFDNTFVVRHPKESQTIVTNVGTLVGGQGVVDTRFLVNESLQGITLPDGKKDPTFEDLQNNAATVLGSFYALDEQGFHSVVPSPGETDPEIQEAIFLASNEGAIDALLADEPFPTTEEIVEVFVDYLPPGSPFTKSDFYPHVFGSGIQLSLTADSVEGEGELFPHAPNSDSLFSFVFGFNEDEEFSQEVRLEVPVDMQSPVNVNSKTGVLPVTIASSSSFDANEIVVSKLTIGGVAVSQTTFNGDDALVAKFSVPALVSAGVLTKRTKELTVQGELEDGSLFQGTDDITVSTNNKK